MSINTCQCDLSSSGEVENSLKKRIEVAQRFDREMKDGAKSTLKKFLGIQEQDEENVDINMAGSLPETEQIDPTVTTTLCVCPPTTSADAANIKEEDIAEEEQLGSVISYQALGPINFAVISACPESFPDKPNSQDPMRQTSETTNNKLATSQDQSGQLPQQTSDLDGAMHKFVDFHDCEDNVDINMEDSFSETEEISPTMITSSYVYPHTSVLSTVNAPSSECHNESISPGNSHVSLNSQDTMNSKLVTSQNRHSGQPTQQKSNCKCDVCGKKFETRKHLTCHKIIHKREGYFKCDICSRVCASSFKLSEHKRIHTGERPFKCNICDKRFSQTSSLNRHKIVHTGERCFKCDVCDKAFGSPSDLSRHQRTHTREKHFDCTVCNMACAGSPALSKHKRIHTRKEPFKCGVCGRACVTSLKLSEHERIHTRERLFKCDVCNKRFLQTSSLNRHKIIHIRERCFKCDVCDNAFGSLSELSRHQRTHSEKKPFKCTVCNMACSDSSTLFKHRRIHTRKLHFKCDVCGRACLSPFKLSEHKRTHTGERPFKCDVCNKRFSQTSSLNRHKRIHTGQKPFKCDSCDVAFTQTSTLTRHKRTHKGEKKFRKSTLSNHKTTVNNSLEENVELAQISNKETKDDAMSKFVDIHDCGDNVDINMEDPLSETKQIDSTVTTTSSVYPHTTVASIVGEPSSESSISSSISHLCVNSQDPTHQTSETINKKLATSQDHPGPPSPAQQKSNCKCDVCGKKFKTTMDLTWHKRTHTKDGRFKCDICSKACASSFKLSEHKRIHTGERPFKCDVCNKRFSQTSCLNRHKIIHTGQKPFKCDVCDMTFTQTSTLTRHKRTHR